MQMRETQICEVIPTTKRARDHMLHRRRKRIRIGARHVDRPNAHVTGRAVNSGHPPLEARDLPPTPPTQDLGPIGGAGGGGYDAAISSLICLANAAICSA